MILIAEREMIQALELEQTLQGAGYQVESRSTLEEALQALESQPVELAIVGLGLPTALDGAAFARVLAQRRVPFLVYTGFGRDQVHGALGDVVPAGVIVKPALPSDLLMAVEAVLGARRSAGRRREGRSP